MGRCSGYSSLVVLRFLGFLGSTVAVWHQRRKQVGLRRKLGLARRVKRRVRGAPFGTSGLCIASPSASSARVGQWLWVQQHRDKTNIEIAMCLMKNHWCPISVRYTSYCVRLTQARRHYKQKPSRLERVAFSLCASPSASSARVGQWHWGSATQRKTNMKLFGCLIKTTRDQTASA